MKYLHSKLKAPDCRFKPTKSTPGYWLQLPYSRVSVSKVSDSWESVSFKEHYPVPTGTMPSLLITERVNMGKLTVYAVSGEFSTGALKALAELLPPGELLKALEVRSKVVDQHLEDVLQEKDSLANAYDKLLRVT